MAAVTDPRQSLARRRRPRYFATPQKRSGGHVYYLQPRSPASLRTPGALTRLNAQARQRERGLLTSCSCDPWRTLCLWSAQPASLRNSGHLGYWVCGPRAWPADTMTRLREEFLLVVVQAFAAAELASCRIAKWLGTLQSDESWSSFATVLTLDCQAGCNIPKWHKRSRQAFPCVGRVSDFKLAVPAVRIYQAWLHCSLLVAHSSPRTSGFAFNERWRPDRPKLTRNFTKYNPVRNTLFREKHLTRSERLVPGPNLRLPDPK
jgi:hypothetical protein